MSVEMKELHPRSLFKKAIKYDSLISLSTIKDICSKLSIFLKYITMLDTFSHTFVLLLYYDDYSFYVLKLFIYFQF